MKKNFLKKTALALSFVLLLSILFTTVVFAAEEYVKWEFSDDETVLKNVSEGINYSYFWNGTVFCPDSDVEYTYAQSMMYCDVDYINVIASPNYKDAVWIYDPYGGVDVFVTEKGAADLDAFVSGSIGSLAVENADGERAYISMDMVENWNEALRNDEDVETFDVRDIKPAGMKVEVFDVIARDESSTFAYQYGAIYRLSDGNYWYVNFADLENNCFDANGNLSYRGGSIEMVLITDVTTLEEVLASMSYRDVEYYYEWEGEPYLDEDYRDVFTILFWMIYVILVIAPTVPLMVLGVVFANLKKLGKPKYWYSLTAFAALWLIVAILLAIILIIA